jgi:hypothetical protein
VYLTITVDIYTDMITQADAIGLTVESQPAAIKWFVDRNHDYSNLPPAKKLVEDVSDPSSTTAATFAKALIPYYNSLMPAARKAKGCKIGRQIEPASFDDWRNICRGGKNGLSLIVHAMSWWFYNLDPNLEENEADSELYTEVVKDVIWVLDCLLKGAGSITWINEEDGSLARGRKRTEAPVSAAADTRKRFVLFFLCHGKQSLTISYLAGERLD